MTVRDILNTICGDTILYVKNINEKRGAVLLCKNIELYCSDKLLDLPVKRLNAGDYEMKGEGIEWRRNGYRGKVIVCTVDREE